MFRISDVQIPILLQAGGKLAFAFVVFIAAVATTRGCRLILDGAPGRITNGLHGRRQFSVTAFR
jgi:hypothetical protein